MYFLFHCSSYLGDNKHNLLFKRISQRQCKIAQNLVGAWLRSLFWNVNITKARLFSLFGKALRLKVCVLFISLQFFALFSYSKQVKTLDFSFLSVSLGPHFEFFASMSVLGNLRRFLSILLEQNTCDNVCKSEEHEFAMVKFP